MSQYPPDQPYQQPPYSQPLPSGQYAPPPPPYPYQQPYTRPPLPPKKPNALVRLWRWYRGRTRRTQVIIAVLVIGFIILTQVANGVTTAQRDANFATKTAMDNVHATATAAYLAAHPPTPTPIPTPTPTPKPKAWATTHEYTGNGNQKTETFSEKADHWKLLWSCDPNSSFGGSYNVIVDVDEPGKGFPADSGAVNVICKDGLTSGSTEEYTSGTFYFSVLSEGSWALTVQELQ